jgi:hypothetical protein
VGNTSRHNERRMCNMLDAYIWRYGGRDTRV